MRSLIVLTIVLFATLRAEHGFCDNDSDSDKGAILKLEKEFSQAMIDGDVSWFNNTLTEDFKIVLPDGDLWNRAKYVNAWETGALDCSKSEIVELDVRVYGDTAIVIGQGDVAGTADGKPFEHTERWTDIYVKRDGKWMCVSVHVCKVDK